MLALSGSGGDLIRGASEPGRPGFVPYRRVTGRASGRSQLRAVYSPGPGARVPCRPGYPRRVDTGPNADAEQCCLIALAKKPRFCSHPSHCRVGQRNLFSTADVMNAGGTSGSFFRPPSKRPNSSSQVMQAGKTFPSSFKNRPVRTMCGCVPPRRDRPSGRDPRVGWVTWII
jgi:hypothetical protein